MEWGGRVERGGGVERRVVEWSGVEGGVAYCSTLTQSAVQHSIPP